MWLPRRRMTLSRPKPEVAAPTERANFEGRTSIARMSGQNFVSGGYQGGEREAHIEVRPVRKRVADWLLQRILAPPIPFLGPPCPPLMAPHKCVGGPLWAAAAAPEVPSCLKQVRLPVENPPPQTPTWTKTLCLSKKLLFH